MKLLSIKMQSIKIDNKKTLKITPKFIKNEDYLFFLKEVEAYQAEIKSIKKETENRANAIKVAWRIIMGYKVSSEEENLLKKFNDKLYVKVKEKSIIRKIRKNSEEWNEQAKNAG